MPQGVRITSGSITEICVLKIPRAKYGLLEVHWGGSECRDTGLIHDGMLLRGQHRLQRPTDHVSKTVGR